MRRALGVLTLALLTTPAHAVPVELSHQGRPLDAAGVPLDGVHPVEVLLYAEGEGGVPLWEQLDYPDFIDGYYAFTLGWDGPLDDDLFAGDALWMAIRIDDGAELPRLQVASAPFARRAGVATDLRGGVVDALEIRVNGETVIDGSGALVGPGDGDTLGSLLCDLGDVAIFDGAAWVCQPVLDDDTLADLACRAGEVPLFDGAGWICAAASDADTLSGLPCGPGQTVVYDGAEWICASLPGDTLAELPCGPGEFAAFDGARWACAVPTTAWAELVGVPADLADGDADSWAAVSCPEGDLLVVADGVWSCMAAGSVGPDSETVRDWVVEAPLDLAAGTTVGGASLVTGSIAWGEILGVPGDLADGQIGWSELISVPVDLLDGDADSLRTTVCGDGEVLVYDAAGEGFTCGVLLASDTLELLSPLCSDGDVAAFNDATGDWECAPDAVLGALEVLAIVSGSDIDLGAGATIGGAPISTLTLEDAVSAIVDGGALTEGAMPFNGLDEVSNGLLTNQFESVSVGGGEAIPDNNPVGVRSPLVVPDVGVAEWLSVSATVENSDLAGVTIKLHAPDGTVYGLFESEEGTLLVRTWPDPSPPLSGDLTEWVGRNPAGTWELEVIDELFLDNTFDGTVVEWSVGFQYVADGRVGVQGRLEVADSLSVDADLFVGGGLMVTGDATVNGDLFLGGAVQLGDSAVDCEPASA
ncbi:MAG: subtilisin-like proprotein convertase family protein [Myxococcota bacterium]